MTFEEQMRDLGLNPADYAKCTNRRSCKALRQRIQAGARQVDVAWPEATDRRIRRSATGACLRGN
eukprot:3930596-Lingulodinium_polyedra.AAC.1